jgi:GxxExxY protein
MNPSYAKADELSSQAIAAAIEVHRLLGPGLLESIYEKCMLRELELRSISARNQDRVQIEYKGVRFSEELKFDLLLEGCLSLELKAVREVLPIHKAQLLSYMKLLDVPIGLVINFHTPRVVDGISRIILPGANQRSSDVEEDS